MVPTGATCGRSGVMHEYVKFDVDAEILLQDMPPATPATPATPESQSSKSSESSNPAPLTPYYPCVVCEGTERWNDHGIWRCRHCWPALLTAVAPAPREVAV